MKVFHGIILMILGWTLAACGAAYPMIECDAPTYDFGTRVNTEEIPHTFVIQNKGGAPLVISNIRNGCGCTRSNLDRNTIPPGESANLSIQVTIRGHIGPKHASIYLHSNDPTNPVFQCHISGIATAEVEITPKEFAVSLPSGSSNLETRISIINRTGIPLNMLNMLINNEFCHAKIVTNAPGVEYTVLVTILTNGIATSTQGPIHLNTDHPHYPVLEIPVSVTVVRDINAFPSEVVMKEVIEGQQQESRYIIVKSFNSMPFRITNIEALPPVIPVGIQSIKPDWVRLRVGPLVPASTMTNIVIRIHTDHPGQPSLDIPFSVSK